MNGFRIIVRFLQKVRNYLSRYCNAFRLTCYGVTYGRKCIIHGKLYVKLFPTAKCHIGNNFYCSSGWNVNALCANKRGAIYAIDNAEIIIGDNVGMSSPVIWAHKRIEIKDNVKIGGNCIIMDTDSHSLDYDKRRDPSVDWGVAKPIIIEEDVLIGMNTIVLKGVTIGARTIIGAGSVVTKSLPSDCIACGNPARIIKYLNS